MAPLALKLQIGGFPRGSTCPKIRSLHKDLYRVLGRYIGIYGVQGLGSKFPILRYLGLG